MTTVAKRKKEKRKGWGPRIREGRYLFKFGDYNSIVEKVTLNRNLQEMKK